MSGVALGAVIDFSNATIATLCTGCSIPHSLDDSAPFVHGAGEELERHEHGSQIEAASPKHFPELNGAVLHKPSEKLIAAP